MEGTPFGRYELIELLGRGGMGEVWRAFDPDMNRVVALKVLPHSFADDRAFQERFRREARSAAGLDEPHVVPIYEFGEIEGRLYVTMRLVKGRDLQDLLEDGSLPPERAVKIVDQIASALQAAHDIGLVHRDVKPSNILVAQDDFAYLIDFGIARTSDDTRITSTGATVGTWAYMAPERFRTGTADTGADVYALTCVLYQCLTGQLPFPGHSLEQVAAAHMFEQPPRPSSLKDVVPAEMDEVIATGMAKEPDQRYATTKDLARAARTALPATMPQPGPPPTPTQPAQRPTKAAASAKKNQTPPRHVTPTATLQKASAQPPRVSVPQLHSGSLTKPRRVRLRWIVLALTAILLLTGGTALTIALLGGSSNTGASQPASQEELVRQTIQDFDTAVQKGDLATLRAITCGTTHDNYVNYSDTDWAATHARVAAAKQYPVVASIDNVVVNGQHATADVTMFMAYAPQVRSVRSFDLQWLDGRWKICEGLQ